MPARDRASKCAAAAVSLRSVTPAGDRTCRGGAPAAAAGAAGATAGTAGRLPGSGRAPHDQELAEGGARGVVRCARYVALPATGKKFSTRAAVEGILCLLKIEVQQRGYSSRREDCNHVQVKFMANCGAEKSGQHTEICWQPRCM